MQEKQSESIMVKIARFIVDKRKAFFLVFIASVIYCISSVNKVQVNNDITSYLPSNTETKIGLTIMEEEFVTAATAQVMICNITLSQAEALQKVLEEIEEIGMLTFGDTEEYYKKAKALYSISFRNAADAPETLAAMEEIKEKLDGYDYYISSEVGNDEIAEMQKDMQLILVLALIVIVIVLLFTSKTYMEVPIFLVVFGVSAILNMGTNYWFGTISFITNSIAVVLQLALAIDYAIIMCHRYIEEREKYEAREATIIALSKAIPEIFSSSLTTIAGLMALTMMQLKIGLDMGMVLSKGIVLSLLTVFILMPGLLMLFYKGMDKSAHKNFVPDIRPWGKFVLKTRNITPVIFLVIIVLACYFASKCPYVFDMASLSAAKETESAVAARKIEESFGKSNPLVILIPSGNYEAEKRLLEKTEKLDMVTSAIGLANIPLDDEYMLTDRMNPRRFSEFIDMDVEIVELLYTAYALNEENYGAIVNDINAYEVPVISILLFLFEQMDAGYLTLDEDMGEFLEMKDTLLDAVGQLEGEKHSRLLLNINGDTESKETFALLDEIRELAYLDYEEVVLAGNSTSARDLSESFQGDNQKISVITVLFVAAILLFTFKSAGVPVLLVLTIQGSIWINFSIPYLTGKGMFFLAYLIVSSIQMGATIDYAIVMTNRYFVLKKEAGKKTAVIEAINQSFPTVLTSGSIMTVSGFLIGNIASDPTTAAMGLVLGRGTLVSVILVMSVLPQILFLFDHIIEKTAITLEHERMKTMQKDIIRLNGRVKGHIDGYLNAEMKGYMKGSLHALIDSREENEGGLKGEEKTDEETEI